LLAFHPLRYCLVRLKYPCQISKEYLLSLNLNLNVCQFLETISKKVFFPTTIVAQNRRFSTLSLSAP
jgi:hypothetical protein